MCHIGFTGRKNAKEHAKYLNKHQQLHPKAATRRERLGQGLSMAYETFKIAYGRRWTPRIQVTRDPKTRTSRSLYEVLETVDDQSEKCDPIWLLLRDK